MSIFDKGMLSCPVCREPLEPKEKSISCPRGHCYDIAREGYVNLLMSNQSGDKRHGDDKTMLTARAEFLDKGYYQPICDLIESMTLPYVAANGNGGTEKADSIIDCGCGDGWYSRQLIESYAGYGVFPDYIGVDISKTAVRMAAKRCAGMLPVVASAYDLPLRSGCADLILSIFSPVAEEEFHRVLKRGGLLFTAAACERHLYGLKKAVYEKPYLNRDDGGKLDGFNLEERRRAEYMLTLDGEDIRRLFMMTPYYYKTSRKDQEKLDGIDHLETEVSVEVRRYRSV